MPRVFVYEFTCAAPVASVDAAGAAALNAEGAAMLEAILADFGRVSGVEAFTIRNERNEPAAFRAAAARADWALVIAPEFDGILEQRCRWALAAGSKLLGPPPVTVALCADKLALAEHWFKHGVPTPATAEIQTGWHALSTDAKGVAGDTTPFASMLRACHPNWVVKPRFGAGSLATLLNGELKSRSELGPMIVQPLIRGLAASVAFFCGAAERIALPPAEQLLSGDGKFKYLGGRLPLAADFAERATAIAQQAVAAVFGLRGYVGVDVVLGDDGRDWAIEINPRLTTSYIGLRALAESNLAEAMLRLAERKSVAALKWRSGRVEFTPDGRWRVDA